MLQEPVISLISDFVLNGIVTWGNGLNIPIDLLELRESLEGEDNNDVNAGKEDTAG